MKHLGRPEVIAVFLVPCPEGGFVLLESGPGSTLPALERAIEEAGYAVDALRGVFVTHVHLDHAGAAGALSRRTGAFVAVHPEGARHMADPSRLLASAARIYGDLMDTLWGTMVPVPPERLRTVAHGETVETGGLQVLALHTPGHARHHAAWQVGGDIATGDVGGIRLPGWHHVLPPTPPPDIDIAAWLESVAILRQARPERLLVTHFGIFDDPEDHLDRLEEALHTWLATANEVVTGGGDAEALTAALDRLDRERLEALGADEAAVEAYRRACPMAMNGAGLYRAVTVG